MPVTTKNSVAPSAIDAAILHALFESASQGIVTVDGDGCILMVNQQTERLFGYGREELIGRELEVLIPRPFRQGHVRHRTDFFSAPRARPMGIGIDLAGLRKDGTEFPVEISLSFVAVEDTRIALAMITDITERKRAEQALREAKDAAEVANNAKSRFLATISHDIRTPIHGILGITDLIAATELDSRQRDLLHMLESTSRILRGVIDGVLDLSRIEAGKMELRASPFSLREAVESVVESQLTQASFKHLSLACEFAPDLPEVLLGDAARVQQVLLNLVGNAIKFTDRGKVTVRVRTRERGLDEATIELEVADTGPGISTDLQKQMFEPFTSGDPIRRDGTGLGLGIARRLSNLMGGDIHVSSEPGLGSTFRVHLRLALPSSSPSSVVKPASQAPTERKLRVLVAEDNRVNRAVAVGLLSRRGHEVVTVNTGAAAVAASECGEFDLVLMDLFMPEMDGLQATKAIRQREMSTGSHVPIVVVTAQTLAGEEARCRAAGADGYLAKPFKGTDLESCLLRFAG